MRLGVAPSYPMIISQKTMWLEEFPEAVGIGLREVTYLTLYTFFYQVLHITFITRPVKLGLHFIKSFLSGKMPRLLCTSRSITVLRLGGSTVWLYVIWVVEFIILTQEAISDKAFTEPSRTVSWKGTLFDMVFEISQLWVTLLSFSKGIRVS